MGCLGLPGQHQDGPSILAAGGPGSASCSLLFLYVQNSNVENLPPHIIRLVYKEVTTLTADPPDGIKVFPNEEDLTDLQVTIEGPGECGTGRRMGVLIDISPSVQE